MTICDNSAQFTFRADQTLKKNELLGIYYGIHKAHVSQNLVKFENVTKSGLKMESICGRMAGKYKLNKRLNKHSVDAEFLHMFNIKGMGFDVTI